MSPAFPGRVLNFLQEGQNLTGDGVFYHDIYHVTLDGASGFRARAQSEERDDLYWLRRGDIVSHCDHKISIRASYTVASLCLHGR